MTAYADSLEALKAQAVAIRTFVVAKSRQGSVNMKYHNGAHICTDYNHCMAWKTESEYNAMHQRYRTLYEEAVSKTEGQVVTYNGNIAWTYFHWCSYGYTEGNVSGLGGGYVPYLVPVYSPVVSGVEMIQKRTFTAQELMTRLFGAEKAAELRAQGKLPLGAITESEGGRLGSVVLYGQSVKGSTLRSKLGLKSTSLTVSYDYETEIFTFVALGSGHGVGMSQVGARAYAIEGKSYFWILSHYYPGTTLKMMRADMIS